MSASTQQLQMDLSKELKQRAREEGFNPVGLARLPAFAVEKHIESGALNRLLCEYECLPERAIYAIYPDKRFLPLKVRKFIDLLYDRLN